jgi:nucleoid-associated protein YgaU
MQDRLMARAAGLQRAAEAESKRRQEEADMADFRRQLRDVDAAKKAARTYTVQPGDTLSAIALAQLGDAGRWPEILQANADKISNPNLIYPGQELSIP